MTGASGFTGGRLLRVFLERGDAVSILVRPSSVRNDLIASGAAIFEGDLRDRSVLSKLVEGADAVVHVAAVYRTAGHPDRYYREINVDATVALLEAAAVAGVRRFVHTSTVGVHGHVKDPPADENAPFAPGDIYQTTKVEGEVAAMELGRKRNVPVVVVRPGAIYGPGETRLLKLFRAIARGRYAVVGSGQPFYHPVYIDDLVNGFLLALERPEAVGQAFILAGPRYLSQDELAALIARHTGGRILPFRIPVWPLHWAGALCELACVPFGIDPPLHRRRVEFWVKSRAFSIGKARRLLDYDPKVDPDQGIARTAAWYREAGWL